MLQEWAQKKYRGTVIEHELVTYTTLPSPNIHIQQHTQLCHRAVFNLIVSESEP
jgi:hypothetical protein